MYVRTIEKNNSLSSYLLGLRKLLENITISWILFVVLLIIAATKALLLHHVLVK